MARFFQGESQTLRHSLVPILHLASWDQWSSLCFGVLVKQINEGGEGWGDEGGVFWIFLLGHIIFLS